MSADRDEAADEELMMSYAGGDLTAFERLFERHRRSLFTFLLHQTGRRAVAEDVFQEVFLKVIRQRERYQPSGSFRSWLFTLARNAVTDERRRSALRDVRQESGSDEASEARLGLESGCVEHDPVGRSHARELRAHIESALLRIPHEQREVFLLRERAGLDFQSIADVTGAGLATVKSRMRYALGHLRRVLAEQLSSLPGCLHD